MAGELTPKSMYMNVLVIENENEMPPEVKDFCTWGLKTGKFTEVEYNLNSRHSKLSDMQPQIMKADAIVVKSNWLYKDQLEPFIHGFARALTHKRYNFYIWDFIVTINQWAEGHDVKDFANAKAVVASLRELVVKHNVYSITGKKIYLVTNAPNGRFKEERANQIK